MKAFPVVKKDGVFVVEMDEPKAPAEVKPGKKTTEAAATIVGSVVAIAAAMGYLNPDQADAVANASKELIGTAAAVLIPSVYVIGRTVLKIVGLLKG
jgi:hypothetical protein